LVNYTSDNGDNEYNDVSLMMTAVADADNTTTIIVSTIVAAVALVACMFMFHFIR